MFLVAYLPQLAVLVFVNGPLAAFTTILLTLSESSTLINLLSRTFLLQDALVDTFDGVLVSRRQTGVLSEGRQLKSGNFNDPMEKLGKLIESDLWGVDGIKEYQARLCREEHFGHERHEQELSRLTTEWHSNFSSSSFAS